MTGVLASVATSVLRVTSQRSTRFATALVLTCRLATCSSNKSARMLEKPRYPSTPMMAMKENRMTLKRRSMRSVWLFIDVS